MSFLDTVSVAKLRKLERNFGSLPVLFAMFLQHGINHMVSEYSPIPSWISFVILAFLCAYLYMNNRKVTEEVDNAVDEMEGKPVQSTLDDYEKE